MTRTKQRATIHPPPKEVGDFLPHEVKQLTAKTPMPSFPAPGKMKNNLNQADNILTLPRIFTLNTRIILVFKE